MKQYKARDKITQKMTRDGAIEVNESKGTKKRISKRAREAVLLKTPEQQAAQDAQAAQPIPGSPAPDIAGGAPPLPHVPGTEPEPLEEIPLETEPGLEPPAGTPEGTQALPGTGQPGGTPVVPETGQPEGTPAVPEAAPSPEAVPQPEGQ